MNKSFPLPALAALVKNWRKTASEAPPEALLLVGHTDTSGEDALNDALSLERARSVKAFIEGDVDTWLERYQSAAASSGRWGSQEDQLMLQSAKGLGRRPPSKDPVEWFQEVQGLTVDGILGPNTRRALIEEYQGSEDALPSLGSTAHGCGEIFPLNEVGSELDPAPKDSERDPIDRRVEFFEFNDPDGIDPSPPGTNHTRENTQYLQWLKKAKRLVSHRLGSGVLEVICLGESRTPLSQIDFALDHALGTIDGQTDAQGRISMRGLVGEAVRLRLRGIDEALLDDPGEGDVVTAADAELGLDLVPGEAHVVVIGLGELSVDTDADEADQPLLVRLTETRTGQRFELKAPADGTVHEGGSELVFVGLPTVNTSYKLEAGPDANRLSVVFEGKSFSELSGLADEIKAAQIEPIPAGEEGDGPVAEAPSEPDPDSEVPDEVAV